MRILVTGGAGFIGSHVADAYLIAGHDVGVVDDLSTGTTENLDPRFHFWQLDIRAAELQKVVADFRPRVISHHAAQISVVVSAREPRLDAEINILGSLNLLEAAVRSGVERVIFASTGGAMYGDSQAPPTAESTLASPLSPYGVAKLAVERYLHAFGAMHGLRGVALRYANVYGPRQSPHGEAGVMAIFSKGVLEGRTLTIHGDGEQTRDYVYVTDIVRANLLATELSLEGELPIFNIGTGRETSVNEIVRLLGEAVGRSVSARHGPAKAGEQRRSALDARLAKTRMGWEPVMEIEEGLAGTLAWFRAHASRV